LTREDKLLKGVGRDVVHILERVIGYGKERWLAEGDTNPDDHQDDHRVSSKVERQSELASEVTESVETRPSSSKRGKKAQSV
jgi:hypothetical protein